MVNQGSPALVLTSALEEEPAQPVWIVDRLVDLGA